MNDRTNLPPYRSQAMTVEAKQVQDRLCADPRFDLDALNVRVVPRDHAVGLVGWVSRLPEKVWIEETASEVVGPDHVESCLLVGPPNQRPDADIARVVRDSLDTDRSIDATSIRVAVSRGVVRLTGIIDSTLHRAFAGAICWWVVGVRGVVNDLDVIYPSTANDESLAEAIQAVMDKDPLVDETEILVLCHGGVVTLTGTVGGADARDAAENDAWIVEGVKDVVNQIEIAPDGPGGPPIVGLGH